jgi:hypothetical protein
MSITAHWQKLRWRRRQRMAARTAMVGCNRPVAYAGNGRVDIAIFRHCTNFSTLSGTRCEMIDTFKRS